MPHCKYETNSFSGADIFVTYIFCIMPNSEKLDSLMKWELNIFTATHLTNVTSIQRVVAEIFVTQNLMDGWMDGWMDEWTR